ncbi:hypothetical protein DOFOFD_07450 [Acetobacteraceae bacterium EV16P]|uniref:Uncharacterized protein n=1 Tax=Sorlinia euscelidii TaxID=3081148 RepID=A0ABU7U4P7_9PROT
MEIIAEALDYAVQLTQAACRGILGRCDLPDCALHSLIFLRDRCQLGFELLQFLRVAATKRARHFAAQPFKLPNARLESGGFPNQGSVFFAKRGGGACCLV